MNYREDLEIKLQKVNLAIAEINDCKFDNEKKKVKIRNFIKNKKKKLL